MNEFGT
jgi:WD40 repeat protein